MDVIVAEEGGVGRYVSAHALLQFSCPILSLCLEGSLFSVSLQAPTQPRVSSHPNSSSPAWVPERLALVCTFSFQGRRSPLCNA